MTPPAPTFRCPFCRVWHLGPCFFERFVKGLETSNKLPQIQQQVDKEERRNWRLFSGLD